MRVNVIYLFWVINYLTFRILSYLYVLFNISLIIWKIYLCLVPLPQPSYEAYEENEHSVNAVAFDMGTYHTWRAYHVFPPYFLRHRKLSIGLFQILPVWWIPPPLLSATWFILLIPLHLWNFRPDIRLIIEAFFSFTIDVYLRFSGRGSVPFPGM